MSPRQNAAFSLVEIVIALGLVAVALVAILSLLPVAMNASRDSIGDTRASLIVQDVGSRVRGLLTNASLALPLTTNYFYNLEGLPETNAASQQFLATLTLQSLPASAYTSLNVTTNELLAASVSLRWPLINGTVPSGATNQPPTVFTWYVNRQ